MERDAPPTAGDDRYYHGTIVRLSAGSRTGWLRSASGREFPFAAADLELVGAPLGFGVLREGLRVGFDLGRTSRGLCVTVIRVYPAP